MPNSPSPFNSQNLSRTSTQIPTTDTLGSPRLIKQGRLEPRKQSISQTYVHEAFKTHHENVPKLDLGKPLPPLPADSADPNSASDIVTSPGDSDLKAPKPPSALRSLFSNAKKMLLFRSKISRKKSESREPIRNEQKRLAATMRGQSAECILKASKKMQKRPWRARQDVSTKAGMTEDMMVTSPIKPLTPPLLPQSQSISLPLPHMHTLKPSGETSSHDISSQCNHTRMAPLDRKQCALHNLPSFLTMLASTPTVANTATRDSEGDYFADHTARFRRGSAESPNQQQIPIEQAHSKQRVIRRDRPPQQESERSSTNESQNASESHSSDSDHDEIKTFPTRLVPILPIRNPARAFLTRRAISDSTLTSLSSTIKEHEVVSDSPTTLQPPLIPSPLEYSATRANTSDDLGFQRKQYSSTSIEPVHISSDPMLPRANQVVLLSSPSPSKLSPRYLLDHVSHQSSASNRPQVSRSSSAISPFSLNHLRKKSPLRQEYSLSNSDVNQTAQPTPMKPIWRVPIEGYFEPQGMIKIDVNEVPDHLPTSPLCPLHPRHRGGVKDHCSLHGAARIRITDPRKGVDGHISPPESVNENGLGNSEHAFKHGTRLIKGKKRTDIRGGEECTAESVEAVKWEETLKEYKETTIFGFGRDQTFPSARNRAQSTRGSAGAYISSIQGSCRPAPQLWRKLESDDSVPRIWGWC